MKTKVYLDVGWKFFSLVLSQISSQIQLFLMFKVEIDVSFRFFSNKKRDSFSSFDKQRFNKLKGLNNTHAYRYVNRSIKYI